MQQPGQLIPAEQINNLAIVAMSGLMAEADFYGKVRLLTLTLTLTLFHSNQEVYWVFVGWLCRTPRGWLHLRTYYYTDSYYLLTYFYNKALGAGEDLKVLNNVLLRCTPSLPAEKQQVGVVWLLNLLWLLTLATYCGYANHAYVYHCFATLAMALLTHCHVRSIQDVTRYAALIT